jgi:uncharacterized membrane protein
MNRKGKTYNQIAGQRVQRLDAISDGVFAIALTLLVLDLRVPVSDAIKTEMDLFHSFCSLTPKMLSYFLSFMTLGIFWTGHTAQYSYIEKSDRNLNWISLFFLLFVSLLPFTTAFLSEHIRFRFSIGLYWLNIFALGLMLYLQWTYALKQGFLSLPADEVAGISKALIKRIVVAQSLYAFGALLCFMSNYLSIAVIILVQLNYALAFFSGKSRNKQ